VALLRAALGGAGLHPPRRGHPPTARVPASPTVGTSGAGARGWLRSWGRGAPPPPRRGRDGGRRGGPPAVDGRRCTPNGGPRFLSTGGSARPRPSTRPPKQDQRDALPPHGRRGERRGGRRVCPALPPLAPPHMRAGAPRRPRGMAGRSLPSSPRRALHAHRVQSPRPPLQLLVCVAALSWTQPQVVLMSGARRAASATVADERMDDETTQQVPFLNHCSFPLRHRCEPTAAQWESTQQWLRNGISRMVSSSIHSTVTVAEAARRAPDIRTTWGWVIPQLGPHTRSPPHIPWDGGCAVAT